MNGPEDSAAEPPSYEPDHEPSSEWDTDEALAALKMERDVAGDMTNEALTRKIIDEAGPLAAQSLVHLALHSQNENTRARCASEIVKMVTDDVDSKGGAVWEDMLADAMKKVEAHANGDSDA
jgi:hypothetical protein